MLAVETLAVLFMLMFVWWINSFSNEYHQKFAVVKDYSCSRSMMHFTFDDGTHINLCRDDAEKIPIIIGKKYRVTYQNNARLVNIQDE